MTDGKPGRAPRPAKENPFAKMSNSALADVIGDLDAQGDLVSGRMKLAKAEMTRRHASSLDGVRYTVVKATEEERRLDAAGLRAKYGDDWYEGWYRTHERTKYTIRAKPPEELGVPA